MKIVKIAMVLTVIGQIAIGGFAIWAVWRLVSWVVTK